jgi:hypothetical protein
MRNTYILPMFFFVCFALLSVSPLARAASGGWAGSEACMECHAQIYSDFRASGHPFKLQKVEEARHRPLPLPSGWSWDDLSYVIGGATKKARFVDKEGYIVTAARDGSPAPTQFNLATGGWVDYHPGEKKKYSCGPCHTTGYSKEGNQDGLEGVVGTWEFPGVQCEACHGPSAGHISRPEEVKPVIDRTSAACGQCHIRGGREKIPAKGGFIQHHEQYNELLVSPHGEDPTCVDCHDPHKRTAASVKVACADCHEETAAKYGKENIHGRSEIGCRECHMPYAAKSAVKFDDYVGDVRTHIFRINVKADYVMFTEDGKFAGDAVSIDFVCLGCHKGRDRNWAADNSGGIHK